MAQSPQPVPAGRDADQARMEEAFIRTGKVPLGLALRKGVASLLRDPWLMWIYHLPGPLGFKLRSLYFGRKLAAMGKGVVIAAGVQLAGARNIRIGEFTYIDRACILEAPEGFITIGKRCHLNGCWVLGHGGVEIGNGVGAAGVILSATDSHKGGHRMSGPMVPMEQRHIRRAKVVVEDDAFISQFAIVLPGVRVGQGAVVGPHSLVVSNVKPWTIVMGSPARVIGAREPVKFPPIE